MKSLKRTSKIQTKIKTVSTQMFSVGVVAIIGLFLIGAPASGFSGSGAGTPADPYQITKATQLQEMKDNLNAHYVLMNDIDCSDTVNWNGGAGFEPVGYYDGSHHVFRGTFDGQGYVITRLYINRPSTYFVGLFGEADQGSIIKNIGLEDVDIAGGNYVGGLVAYTHYATISNCHITGDVTGTSNVGGLVLVILHSTVSNSYSAANVTGDSLVGGLAGYFCDGQIINCYSTGNVNGTSYVGGLIGGNGCAHNAYIYDSYSTGNVNGTSYVGGLMGHSTNYITISNSYSTGSVTGSDNIGGLVGKNDGTITNCYYNNHAGNPSVGIGSGPGDCTAIGNNESYFYYSSNPPMDVWDFVSTWGICEGCSYPYLLWQPPIVDTTPPEIICPEDITVERESGDGTVVEFDCTATDNVDPVPIVTCDPPSGSTFPLATTTVTCTATDASDNSSTCTFTVTVVDTTPPQVEITFPAAGLALQDGVTLTAVADDLSGVSDVYFYVREPDGGDGIPIGCEDLPAAWNGTTELWEFDFNTTGLLDGYYVILAKAIDTQDNEGWSEVVPFSIRNWAVLELLPASKSNKAGRTMPIKFSLRIAESVDAMMPFVYNEELEIIIYDAADPDTILQTSLYGDTSRDYRIDSVDELYITNFKTKKQPAEYVVEIWRLSKDFLVESFTFETVK